MKQDPPSPSRAQTGKVSRFIKAFIFILEIALIVFFLVWWLSSDSVQQSKNLWVLFFYCFPSEFLIAIVPHEPVILYFGKFYSPLTVALVTAAGTVLTEILNYSAFGYVSDTKFFQKVRHRKTVTRIIEYFKKAPFIALWIAGFTPVPFYPFRFLVVMCHYPRLKYLIAVFLSRTPRFYILAQIGYTFKIPGFALLALFLILLIFLNVQLLGNFIKKDITK